MAQEHLSSIAHKHGTGEATSAVRSLLELGMVKKLEQEKAQRAAEGKDKREYPYVSEAGKCARQVYFALTNEPKTEALTLDSYVTLRMGNKAEEIYMELLEAAGVTILAQERVELDGNGEKVVGKLDLLIEVPEHVRKLIPGLDEREIWELKTKSSRALGWLLKRGGPDAEDAYVKQIRAYVHAGETGKAPKPTKARGRLVYTATGATKGEPLFHAWFVEADSQAVENDLIALGQAMKDARDGLDPGIPPEFSNCPNFPCNYCDWRSLCFPRGGISRGPAGNGPASTG